MHPSASDVIAASQLRLAVLARNEKKLVDVLRKQLNKLIAVLDSKRYADFNELVYHSCGSCGPSQGYIPCPDVDLECGCGFHDSRASVRDSTRTLLFELTGKHDDSPRNDCTDIEDIVLALQRIQCARAILNAKLPRPRKKRVTKV